MKKIIKIGFPIICIAVIAGTFILLNKTTDRINRNKLQKDEIDNSFEENIINEVEDNTNTENIVELSPEEAQKKEIENKAKAIEIVKRLAPPLENVYYTNEGKVENNYLVAIKDNDTKNPKIYYSVDVENEEIEIYVK